ncbi:MAG: Ig-like domain-containing protein, partial [Anaerococcus sp.]|nr:Ig-like domain-containing protein [Anaerococcus sp.]
MEKNDILKRIIEEKKLNGSKKKPKYATRKLSVGLVSCMLGYALLFSPSSAKAAGEIGEEIVAEDKVEPSSDNQSSNEQPSDDQIVDNAANDNVENNVEENKEVAEPADQTAEPEVSEEKEAQTADIEKESDDKLVEDKEDTDKTVEEDKKESLENKDSIEFSPEDNRENDRVSAEASKDISNNIINPRVSIRTENTTTPGTLDAGLGEQLTWGVSFTTPEGTKEGDTFTVKLSDNMSLKGLEPDTDYAVPVKFGDKIIANAKRIDRQTIQYTFTKVIEDLKYARVYIINSAQENKDVVRNSGDQTFKINVGEKAKAEKDINVDFGKLYHAETSENVNGKSQFTEFNPETGEFTQVFYLNPESKVINTSSTNDQNGREFGKVGFILASPHDGDKPRSIDYLANNTKIEVKKLPKGAKLPDAIIENPEGAQLATNAHGGFRNFKGEPMFTMDFGGGNKIDSPYVVVVKGHANKIDGKYTNLYSIGTLYGDGAASLFLDNSYTVQENSTDSEGVKETLGYFKEHHIYITKENGKETSRFEIPGATVSGTADEYYYTDKNEIPGYHFVKIGEGKNAPKNNPAYDDQGKITQGHFKVGETKEVTYIYENDITTKGSFTEHHVYEVYKDGVKQEDQTTTIDITADTNGKKF